MRVLTLNTSDTSGGAGIAAYRLHKGLRSIGIESQMYVKVKHSNDDSVSGYYSESAKIPSLMREYIDMSPVYLYRHRQSYRFSPSWLPGRKWQNQISESTDIVHLHWINSGFIRIEDLENINKPIVWTLHDMWAFTGGCHYDGGCEKYIMSCKRCPILGSDREKDLAYRIFERKRNAWHDLNLTIVTPSRWLADCTQKSTLLSKYPIKVIPNGLDFTLFKPINKRKARDLLKIPQGKKVVLFGAMSATSDQRKGFKYLRQALQHLTRENWGKETALIIFGDSQPKDDQDLGYQSFYMGRLKDNKTISALYSAADVFIAPSLQDNLPNTIMESLACGTPCIAFNIGGMPDMIEHKKNGYLARPYDSDDLANGIKWVLGNDSRWVALSLRAREKTEQEFEILKVSNRYREIYKEAVTIQLRNQKNEKNT